MKNVFIAGILIFVIILGGYFVGKLFIKTPNQATNTQPEVTVEPSSQPSNQLDASMTEQSNVTESDSQNVVMYTNNGFELSTLTVTLGETVMFKNESSSSMWVASAMHPSHSGFSNTTLQEHCPDVENNDFDQCTSVPPGGSWSFTFLKTGDFPYHNHVKANHFGKIVVE